MTKGQFKAYALSALIAAAGLYGMITGGFKVHEIGSNFLYNISPFVWKYSPSFTYGYMSLLIWGGIYISGIFVINRVSFKIKLQRQAAQVEAQRSINQINQTINISHNNRAGDINIHSPQINSENKN